MNKKRQTAYCIWSEDHGFNLKTFSTTRKAAWEKMTVTERVGRQLGWRCITVRLVPVSPGIPGYQLPPEGEDWRLTRGRRRYDGAAKHKRSAPSTA